MLFSLVLCIYAFKSRAVQYDIRNGKRIGILHIDTGYLPSRYVIAIKLCI